MAALQGKLLRVFSASPVRPMSQDGYGTSTARLVKGGSGLSSFGWLDTDADQRRRMLEVVDLFRDQGTVDEIGIGTVRDALSNSLFPGTSVLHTRLRYALFIPWLMQRATQRATPKEMAEEFRRLEYRLIDALLAGGEWRGVIGNTARGNLKRMPSVAYWTALGTWRIREGNASLESFFRRAHDLRQLARRTPHADDPEAAEGLLGSGLDPYLPPAPDDVLKSATFTLSPEEEQYLSERIAAGTRGSLFSWLTMHPPGSHADWLWDIDNLGQAPSEMREVADHARRFSIVIFGANLLYNLLLARRAGATVLVETYEEQASQWSNEVNASRILDGWDRAAWSDIIHRQNPKIHPLTMRFIDDWRSGVEATVDITGDARLADVIRNQESRIKRGRARLTNPSALEGWSGASGLLRLDFRWPVVQSHLVDLYRARGSA
jgi:hypothetical protein